MRLSIGERQLPQVHGSKYCPAQWSPASVWGHPVAAQIAMLDTVASQQQRSSYSSTFFPLTSSRMPPTHTTNTEKDTISQSPAKPETTVNSSSGCQLLGRWVMWARHQWPAFPCRWPTHFSPQDQRMIRAHGYGCPGHQVGWWQVWEVIIYLFVNFAPFLVLLAAYLKGGGRHLWNRGRSLGGAAWWDAHRRGGRSADAAALCPPGPGSLD